MRQHATRIRQAIKAATGVTVQPWWLPDRTFRKNSLIILIDADVTEQNVEAVRTLASCQREKWGAERHEVRQREYTQRRQPATDIKREISTVTGIPSSALKVRWGEGTATGSLDIDIEEATQAQWLAARDFADANWQRWGVRTSLDDMSNQQSPCFSTQCHDIRDEDEISTRDAIRQLDKLAIERNS